MITGKTNQFRKPVGYALSVGVAMGFGAVASAQLTNENIIENLEAATYSTVAPLDEMKMYGVLRDFISWHPDFALSTGIADGQYAGNVSFIANSDHKPVYVGMGSEVSTQWRNAAGQPIAPHLYNFSAYSLLPEGVGSYATGSYTLGQGSLIDSWNSDNGTYAQTSDSNALIGQQSDDPFSISLGMNSTVEGSVLIGPGGDATAIQTGGPNGDITGTSGNMAIAPDPLPVIAPVDIGQSIGNVLFNTDTTISSDMHCDNFKLMWNVVVTITGHRTIVCDGILDLGQGSQIQLAPGATLNLYIAGGGSVRVVGQGAAINTDTGDPTLVNIYYLAATNFQIIQNAQVYAMIYAPNATVIIGQGAEVFGRLLASDVNITQGAALHLDEGLGIDINACGNVVADTAGSYGGAHNGGVRDVFSFRTWFLNVPGINATEVIRLPMTGDGTGMFEHTSTDFTIADDLLFGNEGETHNRYFTYEMTAVGQYNMCGGQFFEFTGGGDVWVMINDELVIDMGGQGAGKRQVAEIDRMGFSDGELFTFRFFYAQRTGGAHPFSMKTNIDFVFSDSLQPESSGLYD